MIPNAERFVGQQCFAYTGPSQFPNKNNSSQQNLSGSAHGPSQSSQFSANNNAKAKMFKQYAKNSVMANQLSSYNSSTSNG